MTTSAVRAASMAVLGIVACRSPEDEPVASPVAEPARPVPTTTQPRQEPKQDPPKPPEAFPLAKLPVLPADVNVDTALAAIREVARQAVPELGVAKLRAEYVQREGKLDRTYGVLIVSFDLPDTPNIIDDPDRPTGAPIPERPLAEARTECPQLMLHKGVWTVSQHPCQKVKLPALRCSVAQVWRQALREGAPPGAVAVIERNGDLSFWSFQITDQLRNIDVKVFVEEASCGAPRSAPPR